MASGETTLEIEQPNLLVVEGKEDLLFFDAIIKHMNLQGIQIIPIGGKQKLQHSLRALVNTPGFYKVGSLGIVRDADSNWNDSFKSVCSALRSAGLPAPKFPLMPANGNPRVAVLILPGSGKPGMLEDLCLEAVMHDPAMKCVKAYFQCLDKQGITVSNLAKAKIQAFLASRKEAGKRLGEAAQAGYLPLDHDVFEEVRAFLKGLIDP